MPRLTTLTGGILTFSVAARLRLFVWISGGFTLCALICFWLTTLATAQEFDVPLLVGAAVALGLMAGVLAAYE